MQVSVYKINDANLDVQPSSSRTHTQVTPFQPLLEALHTTRYGLAHHNGYLSFFPLDPEEFLNRDDCVIMDLGDDEVT